MNISNPLGQNALPLEITHSCHWIQPLLESSHFHRGAQRSQQSNVFLGGRLPPRLGEEGLRTVVAIFPEQLQAAEHLVRRRYAWRGYHVALSEDFDAGTPGSEGQPVTLLAEERGKLLGTLTVRPDSPHGLLAEESYASEIEQLRREGHRVGELVKLAVEEGVDWKRALDALVQSAYLVTHVVHALTDVLIEVNPRHVRFYQRMFGFMVAAGERICARAGAPSVLLQLEITQFGRRLGLSAAA